MSSLALSGGGLSVTAPMHGSNSTSSLVSLDHLSDAALLDDDSHAISIADSSPTQRPLPPRPLLLTHDDSDDSDDESQTHRRTPSPPLFSPSPPPFASPAAPSTVALLASARIRTGSCTTRDMAVEMAHIAREASRRESSALPSFSIRLVDTDGLDLGVLPPDADDVFSLETFATLHQQRRAMGRQLIIAQVTTKDKNRAAVNSAVYSYYDAFPLLKVLYKVHASSMGIRLSHRYHQYSAMNPINPLTNTCIIGDVRFFITEAVDGPHSAPYPPSPSSAGGAGGEDYIRATFLCTDYNLSFSPAIRALFLPHCLSSSSSVSSVSPTTVVSIPSPSPSPASPAASPADSSSSDDFFPLLHRLLSQPQKPRTRTIPWEGAGADELHALAQATMNVPPPVRYVTIAFPRAVVYGIVMALYGLVCFLVFEKSLEELINGVQTWSVDISTEWYWLMAPPLALLFDILTAVLYDVYEHRIVYLTKAVVYTLYYTLPLVIMAGDGTGLNVARRVVELIMPIFLLAYSVAYFAWLRRTRRLE